MSDIYFKTGVPNLWPAGHMQSRMAMNAAQLKIVNYLKHYEFFCDYMS